MRPREFDAEQDHWRGREDGKVVAIIYSDYTCPNCRVTYGANFDISESIGERGAFVHRHRPDPRREPEATRAARAAIAAGHQCAFWDMSEALFKQVDFSETALCKLAEETLGLDVERFRADLNAEATARKVAEDAADAERAGVAVTPSLFLNGRLYDGAWDVDAVLEAVQRPGKLAVSEAFRDFFSWAAAGGLVLIVATLLALLVANVGFHEAYEHLLETVFALSLGERSFGLPVEAWINDGLMAVFFLLVGIEIKRELIEGELSDPASAILPLIAAAGGMAVPAILYTLVNLGGDAAQGWGVPMATDIAFTIGLLALLGTRTPPALKIFVSALAVADDLGAIVVIALFYGHGFHVEPFIIAVVVLAIMIGLNLVNVYSRFPYVVLGVLLWVFVHDSGLHATLAGVLTAAAIPSRPRASILGIAAQTSAILEASEARGPVRADLLGQLERAIDRLREPGYHVERNLQRFTNFLILPLFAFANTGIIVGGGSFSLAEPEVLGVMVGLCIGKPLGITGVSLLAVRMGWARMPTGVNATQLIGAGCLAGVGFTMSIFIATSAFEGAELAGVKLAILLASTLSAVVGVAILWMAGQSAPAEVEATEAARI